jgi:hypothetical protein
MDGSLSKIHKLRRLFKIDDHLPVNRLISNKSEKLDKGLHVELEFRKLLLLLSVFFIRPVHILLLLCDHSVDIFLCQQQVLSNLLVSRVLMEFLYVDNQLHSIEELAATSKRTNLCRLVVVC